MTLDQVKLLQKVVGKFLFYAKAVDPTMLHILKHLAAYQSGGTQQVIPTMTYFLNYCATHPSATITYEASDMVFRIHSDASYLTEAKLVPSSTIAKRPYPSAKCFLKWAMINQPHLSK